MWNMKYMIIPVIIGATGIVTKIGNTGSCTRKRFNRSTIKDSYTWNMIHNMERTAVWNLKPEWWGSSLVQGKYQEKKLCDVRQWWRRHSNSAPLLIFLTYLYLILTISSVITNLHTFLSVSTSFMLVVGWWLPYSCRCFLHLSESQNVCMHSQKCHIFMT